MESSLWIVNVIFCFIFWVSGHFAKVMESLGYINLIILSTLIEILEEHKLQLVEASIINLVDDFLQELEGPNKFLFLLRQELMSRIDHN